MFVLCPAKKPPLATDDLFGVKDIIMTCDSVDMVTDLRMRISLTACWGGKIKNGGGV